MRSAGQETAPVIPVTGAVEHIPIPGGRTITVTGGKQTPAQREVLGLLLQDSDLLLKPVESHRLVPRTTNSGAAEDRAQEKSGKYLFHFPHLRDHNASS